MQDASRRRRGATEYGRIDADPHHHAWLGRVDGEPAFLAETYDPAHSELAGAARAAPGDLGMHVLVAPTGRPRSTASPARSSRAVMEHCFADPGVRRVVVEPDVRNDAIRALNAAVGLPRSLREIPLPTKTAALVLLRERFARRAREGTRRPPHLLT